MAKRGGFSLIWRSPRRLASVQALGQGMALVLDLELGHGTPGYALPGYPHVHHPGYTTCTTAVYSMPGAAVVWEQKSAMGSEWPPIRARMDPY